MSDILKFAIFVFSMVFGAASLVAAGTDNVGFAFMFLAASMLVLGATKAVDVFTEEAPQRS